MKVFISQPMNGKTNEQIREEREELVKTLSCCNEVIDSVIAESPKDADSAPLFYLSKSIELLGQADVVYFMPGWDKARGCMIEHAIAFMYGKKIVDMNPTPLKAGLVDTIHAMCSADYKERFKAEYWQTKIRYEKLHTLLVKAQAKKLDFEPTCPLDLLKSQANAMGNYLYCLEVRAQMESIDL